MEPLIERLTKLPRAEWSGHAPADPAALARVEQTFRVQFPEDYRALLLASDGGAIDMHKSNLNLFPVRELPAINYDEWYRQSLPGAFLIGDDGGGSLYFY